MAIRMCILSLFLFGLPAAQALSSSIASSTSSPVSGEHPISPTDGAHPTFAPGAEAK